MDSAEITATRNGLFLAAKIGCNKVMLESDCSFVVEAVEKPDEYEGQEMATVLQCKELFFFEMEHLYSIKTLLDRRSQH